MEKDAGSARQKFQSLRQLLLAREMERLEEVEAALARVEMLSGDRERFREAVSGVLIESMEAVRADQPRQFVRTLAPSIAPSIRTEIANSREEMVNALYPITGRLVSAAVRDSIRRLAEQVNERVDRLASPRLFYLRLRSLATGTPLSVLELAARRQAAPRRAFLLERQSGSLIAQWTADASNGDSGVLISSMIAALANFARQAYAGENAELETLDLGEGHIVLRHSPYHMLAVDFDGEPKASELARLDTVFIDLVEWLEKKGSIVDDEGFAERLQVLSVPERRASRGRGLALGALLVLLALAYPAYHLLQSALLERKVGAARAAVAQFAELSAYPLRVRSGPEGQIVAEGLVPEGFDVTRLRSALAASAGPDTPVVTNTRPVGAAGEGQAQLGADLARQDERIGALEVAVGALGASGKSLETALQKLESGVSARLDNLERVGELAQRLARLEMAEEAAPLLLSAIRLQFGEGDDFLDPELAALQLDLVAAIVRRSGVRLRVRGHSDNLGTPAGNAEISRARAARVGEELATRGVPAEQIAVEARGATLPVSAEAGAYSANRRVDFAIGTGEQTKP